MRSQFYLLLSLLAPCLAGLAADPNLAAPRFRAAEIDPRIEIGYGVAVADVDGDQKPDILLADKRQIVWYRNPTWEKYVIAENLTALDNVCLAAADIDGDRKAEVAVGAGWNPNDTIGSGAVFYLVPPPDRTQKWEPIALPHEPTVHRMRWIRSRAGAFELAVVPLHGRGNQAGNGAGAKILSYHKPANPRDTWPTRVIDDSLHLTHNLDVVTWLQQPGSELLIAGKEGVFHFIPVPDGWARHQLVGQLSNSGEFAGAGEIRAGKLRGGKAFLATVEPMHGNQLVTYTAPPANPAGRFWQRHVVDRSLKEGHALACGDLLGAGFDQVVIGWRGKDANGKVGIKLFIPLNATGTEWRQALLDDNGIACEDLCLADLNHDGLLDIIAAGRATQNVKVYFNEGPR